MSILIEDIKNWATRNKKDILYIIICTLVGLSCFAIGKLYAGEQVRVPIIIENCPVVDAQAR